MSGAGEAGEAGQARARLPVGRSRLLAVAWLGVLVGTIGLGVLGQARPVADAVPPEMGAAVVPTRAAPSRAAAASATPARATPARPAVGPAIRPAATRPPIGEDGVMGGLPFGTAWLWLERGPASGEATPD